MNKLDLTKIGCKVCARTSNGSHNCVFTCESCKVIYLQKINIEFNSLKFNEFLLKSFFQRHFKINNNPDIKPELSKAENTCINDSNPILRNKCDITVKKQKRCIPCRYNKCIIVGMDGLSELFINNFSFAISKLNFVTLYLKKLTREEKQIFLKQNI